MADVPVLAPAAEEAAKSGGAKLWLIILITLMALAAAGVGAWFIFGGQAAKKAEEQQRVVIGPPQYLALDPPFVVNFEADEPARFLQVTVQLMSRDLPTIELLKANDPVVRNDLLMLFGNQKYAVIASREGKEALRAQTLAAVRKVISAAGGRPERLEAVYFTSFVMQ